MEQYIGYASMQIDGQIVQGEGELHETDAAMAAAILHDATDRFAKLGPLPSREDLRRALPPNGARNALDAMLWDRDCKAARRRA